MPMQQYMLVRTLLLHLNKLLNFVIYMRLKIQGIADGEVAKGIKPYNPIMTGQLSEKK